MSARQELLDALYAGDVWDAPGVPERLIDAYAHELAERQRQFVRRVASNPFRYGSAYWAVRGVDDASDEIDPYVGAGLVRPDEETP